MRRVIVVQARFDSTRLPGKALADLAGAPLLYRELERLTNCTAVDDIVVATTDRYVDYPILALAERAGVRWHRGPTDDVLTRYLGAAREARADVVVRVTGDCPLIAPEVTDEVIQALMQSPGEYEYTSNVVRRSYPRGLDAEAMFFETLVKMDRLSTSSASREHVTLAARSEHPELFRTRDVIDREDNSDLRWTVDTREDLALARQLYRELDIARRPQPYRELVRAVRARREWCLANADGWTWSPT